MRLVLPSLRYESEYLKALGETKEETGDTRLNRPDPNQTFAEFVKMWRDQEKGINLKEGTVPATMYWLIDQGELIGRVHIKHSLNDILFKFGGQIGYYIRPSKRRMGYGTKILKLALKKAKKMGLPKVLVTCDDTNIGSQKIIESCGGVLEVIVIQEKGKPQKKRFWIRLGN